MSKCEMVADHDLLRADLDLIEFHAINAARHATLCTRYFLRAVVDIFGSISWRTTVLGGLAAAAAFKVSSLLTRKGFSSFYQWQLVGVVSELYIYPVKSLAGIKVNSFELDDYGAANDRRWLVVDESDSFITQRQDPRLATVQVQLLPDSHQCEVLRLAAPGMEPLSVALRGPASAHLPTRTVRVWGDVVDGLDCGDEAARWLSSLLGRPARLVGMAPSFARDPRVKHAEQNYTPPVSPRFRCAKEIEWEGRGG